jgi:hypothetical protein
MGRRAVATFGVTMAAVLAAAPSAGTRPDAARAAAASAASRSEPARAAAATDRYSLANGCYELQLPSGQQLGPFRMQAATLGEYLLYGVQGDFLGPGMTTVTTPSASTVWRVDNGFTMTNTATGQSTPVSFAPAAGCAVYPEGQVDASGTPFSGSSPGGQVNGTIDAHTHVTAFEFLGGDFHCGKPWDEFGIPYALPDCARYEQGTNGQIESFLDYGAPLHMHDTKGWPTFHDWPSPTDLAEEGDYYTGIKRAWMAGLRVMVTQLVDNEALCELMTTRHNPCNDMDAVRLQAADLRALQDYIDAQSGGPGKGFFRIVTNPFQARQVINEGKLAVVEGIEVSDLFNCKTTCTQAQVDAGLKEVRSLGVSTFFPIHKFDNAFGGTKMDAGELGLLVNAGNHLETGHFWDIKTCTGPEHDQTQLTSVPSGLLGDLLNGLLHTLVPSGTLPVYPPPPHCNQQGLTGIGAYLINQMIQQHFILELDHMDAKTADAALSILEAHHYSGVISAHSWDSPEENPRIYNLGGFVTPIAGASPAAFVSQWRDSLKIRNPHYYDGTGFGYGADMNGLAEESQPTSGTPIGYPFTSFDGHVTFTREQWGQRVFDINRDGVANYGMFPDWLQELQVLAGRPILADMFHGAEAYLEMWERAYGVPASTAQTASARLTARGLGALRLGSSFESVLLHGGQPVARPGRAYQYSAGSRGAPDLAAVFNARGTVSLVVTSARRYGAGGIAPGRRMRSRGARSRVVLGRKLAHGARFVYLVRSGRVRLVGVVSAVDARSARALRADLAASRLS